MKINSSKIIEIKNLTVKYSLNQSPVLRDLQIDIKKGEHLAVIGSSGCGKSTLAKSIIKMLPKGSICEGQVTIAGRDLISMNKEELQIFRRQNFGFIYQDAIKRLNPLMSVGDHLFEQLKIHWRYKSNASISKLVKENFNKVGISSKRLNSYPHEFSGGMRQRVCIAMALALNPLILIADEPTTSLDSHNCYEIMKQLLELCDLNGSTLLLISHDIKLAEKWCKNVVILDKGVIKERGDIHTVFNQPQSNIAKKLVNTSFSSLAPNSSFNEKEPVILEVDNLRHWYRLNSSLFNPLWNKALNQISFKLKKNETLGIVGISGSGKSTLGRALVGIIKNRGGKIYINIKNSEIEKNKKLAKAKNIQMIFQDPFSSLNPKMSIISILEDIFSIHNPSSTNMHNEIRHILKMLNLPIENSFLDSYPRQLSGGQLQRISIARVLLIRPKILICDESLNMLDAVVKFEILQLLRAIQKEMNISIIFITHDLGLAQKFCNRILIMNKGSVIEEGNSSKIFKNPQHEITKTLIKSSLNI